MKVHSSRRGAFTIIELLVVISIIGMLASLMLPAVVQSRATARRAECANNLRNVGLAILGDADAKRRFPASGYFGSGGEYHNWVVTVLPRIERGDVQRLWDFSQPRAAAVNAKAITPISVLVCPADDSAPTRSANLSYVVNAGIGFTMPQDCPATYRAALNPPPSIVPIDLNGNGLVSVVAGTSDGQPSDRTLFPFLSLFFIENWPSGTGTVRHHSLDSVADGTSRTILLTENVRAGYDAAAGADWSTPEPRRNAFMLSGYICDNASCSSGNVDYHKSNDRSSGPWRYEAINSALKQQEGQAPWPSSNHVDGVNVMFVDGHVRFLSQDVDGAVYSALVTPAATRLTGPLREGPLGDDGY